MTPTEFNEHRAKIAGTNRYDPLGFAEQAWPWGKPGTALEFQDIRVWQSEVLDELSKHLQNPATRFKVFKAAIVSGHGSGKSALVGMLCQWAMACYRDPRIVITAQTEAQLRTKTSPEVGQWFRSSMYADLFDIDTLSIRYKARPTQHRVDFSPNSEHTPEAFAGLHARGRLVMVVVDEASGIPEVIFETIMGALTDEKTVLIFIMLGNPVVNTGFFREAFRRNRKQWKTWQLDSRDVEGTNKDVLNAIAEQYGEDSDVAKVRVRGVFPSASPRQFIATTDVDRAFGRHLRKEQYDFAPVILTCDPAWEGDDELVIGLRQGLKFEILEVMAKNDNDVAVAAKLAHYETHHKADAVFLDAGYGTGIFSAGQTMGRAWQLVWFGGEASDKGCLNKRSNMWRDMRDWLKEGGAIPSDQQMYDDLIGPETLARLDGKIALEGKASMKKRKLPSPGRGDALALSFAFPVQKKHSQFDLAPIAGAVIAQQVYEPEAYRS